MCYLKYLRISQLGQLQGGLPRHRARLLRPSLLAGQHAGQRAGVRGARGGGRAADGLLGGAAVARRVLDQRGRPPRRLHPLPGLGQRPGAGLGPAGGQQQQQQQ